jgi:hypothetical protein
VADGQRSAEDLAGLSKVSVGIAGALTAALGFVLKLGVPKWVDILTAGVTAASAFLAVALLFAERRASERERRRGPTAALSQSDRSGLRRLLAVLAPFVVLAMSLVGFVVGQSGVNDGVASSPSYAEGLQELRGPLNSTRARERRALSSADTSKQQFRAADRLRTAFARALKDARRLRVPPQHKSANDRIRTALAEARDAYADLARAARAHHAAAFEKTKDDVRHAERRVQAALEALGELGYIIV